MSGLGAPSVPAKMERPPGRCDQRLETTYVFGAVEPATGRSFALVLPYADRILMNLHIAEFAETVPPTPISSWCSRVPVDMAPRHSTSPNASPSSRRRPTAPSSIPSKGSRSTRGNLSFPVDLQRRGRHRRCSSPRLEGRTRGHRSHHLPLRSSFNRADEFIGSPV